MIYFIPILRLYLPERYGDVIAGILQHVIGLLQMIIHRRPHRPAGDVCLQLRPQKLHGRQRSCIPMTLNVGPLRLFFRIWHRRRVCKIILNLLLARPRCAGKITSVQFPSFVCPGEEAFERVPGQGINPGSELPILLFRQFTHYCDMF